MHIPSSIKNGKTENILKYFWKQALEPRSYRMPIEEPRYEERKALKCSENLPKKELNNFIK